MELEIGYVVSEMVLTGPERGTYKVWVPKKHGDPTSKDSYNGFGSNFGNLGSGDLLQIRDVAESYYPMMPLSSGGHIPFDPESGLATDNEIYDKITIDSAPVLSGGQVSRSASEQHFEGGQTFKFPQSQAGLFQTYTLGTMGGETINTREGAPSGSYCDLSIGTKVVVCGNIILGQLPPNQNDWINQMRPPSRT